MNLTDPEAEERSAALARAGFGVDAIRAWSRDHPVESGDLATDSDRFGGFWRSTAMLLGRLPSRAARSAAEQAAAERLLAAGREARERFLRRYASLVYDVLTERRTRFLRAEALCERAALAYPGLVPDRATLEREAAQPLRDKDGHEIDQGLLLAHVLADPDAGAHLCHAMLLPRAESGARLGELARAGAIDLGAASVRREGRASIVTLTNPRFLNAEDETTLAAAETAVDLALLDPATEICVLRGSTVEHPKYAGRRVFGAGINLTHLYLGRIPYLFYLTRDLGCVNKIYRGIALPDQPPDDTRGRTIEKPWIATAETFAIGGHCQYLLVMDHIIAARDAYMTLPARKEGIIPGAANMRLPRFVGDRIARQAILLEKRLDCDSPEGRLICDEVVAPEAVDAALAHAIDGFTGSGVVSAAGNRRALRVVQEPLDDFRRYFATYAREQAYCHLSPALIANLERHWNAHQRRI
jgi:thioesterase DpgC